MCLTFVRKTLVGSNLEYNSLEPSHRYCDNKGGADGRTDGQPENTMLLAMALTSVEAIQVSLVGVPMSVWLSDVLFVD